MSVNVNRSLGKYNIHGIRNYWRREWWFREEPNTYCLCLSLVPVHCCGMALSYMQVHTHTHTHT